jgi:hypothetical protein
MGILFPEVFGSEVPCAAVALAATAVTCFRFMLLLTLTNIQIKLALDEVSIEGKEVTFKRDVYASVYIDILGLMGKCDTNPIHRAKMKALHVQWGKTGRYMIDYPWTWLTEFRIRNGSMMTTTTGFEVDLD